MKKQQIKFRAVKVIQKPVVVDFYAKDGTKITFDAVKGYEIPDPEKMVTKELIKWLKKNGFPHLAKSIEEAIK